MNNLLIRLAKYHVVRLDVQMNEAYRVELFDSRSLNVRLSLLTI